MNTEKKNTILAAVVGGIFLLGFLVNDPFLLFESSYEKSKPLISGKVDSVKKVTLKDTSGTKIFTRTTDGWTFEIPGNPMGVQRADVMVNRIHWRLEAPLNSVQRFLFISPTFRNILSPNKVLRPNTIRGRKQLT